MKTHTKLLTSKSKNHWKRPQAIALIMTSLLVTLTWLETSVNVTPARAESEASSEAGSEAQGYLGGRRRRRRNFQQQQIRQERRQEAAERNKQQRAEKRQLSRGPQIKSYGNHRRQRQGLQGQNVQNSQGVQNVPAQP